MLLDTAIVADALLQRKGLLWRGDSRYLALLLNCQVHLFEVTVQEINFRSNSGTTRKHDLAESA
jgi:hypothetical protein